MAKRIGKNHLLKKSILLLKMWFTYEANLLGSYASCMATYGLYVLVLFIINNFYHELETPMDVFKKFFQVWGAFDWDSNIVSIYTPIKAHNFYDNLKSEVSLPLQLYSACLTWTNWQWWRGTCIGTTRTGLCFSVQSRSRRRC